MSLAPHADHHMAQSTVIEIKHTLPNNTAHIDIERISLLDMIVNYSRQQVMSRSNRMEVTREVQIDILHRHNLCIAATGSTTLETKTRA